MMLYRDLARAGIEHETASGMIDLHSLRHTFVSNVVATGATVKTAQELARYSTPVLTFGVYAHARLADIASTVENLPDPFASKKSEALSATGTDPATPAHRDLTALCQRAGDVSGRFVAHPGTMGGESAFTLQMTSTPGIDASGRELSAFDGGSQEMRQVGIEPTTFGFEVRDSIR